MFVSFVSFTVHWFCDILLVLSILFFGRCLLARPKNEIVRNSDPDLESSHSNSLSNSIESTEQRLLDTRKRRAHTADISSQRYQNRQIVVALMGARKRHQDGEIVNPKPLIAKLESRLASLPLDDLARVTVSIADLDPDASIFRSIAREAVLQLDATEHCNFKSVSGILRGLASVHPKISKDVLDEFRILFRVVYLMLLKPWKGEMQARDLVSLRGAFGHMRLLSFQDWITLQNRVADLLAELENCRENSD